MANSKIEWTEATWNPFTGCDKISPGCKNCYAEIMAGRLMKMGQEKYRNNFEFNYHPKTYDWPLTQKKPLVIFTNSMSDLFHEQAPIGEIQKVFGVMNEASWHTFQVLTKRPENVLENNDTLKWGDNIWLGTSVENSDYTDRIDVLRETGAKIKFLSLEPLLGPLPNLNLDVIDWVIVGGESGRKSREIKKEWVVDIQQQCEKANVPFFFKQWGGKNKKKAGRLLNGKEWSEMPTTAN